MVRPNGLALSRRLEGTTLIDWEVFFLLLDAKIATIQPVGSSAVLGGHAQLAVGCGVLVGMQHVGPINRWQRASHFGSV